MQQSDNPSPTSPDSYYKEVKVKKESTLGHKNKHSLLLYYIPDDEVLFLKKQSGYIRNHQYLKGKKVIVEER